MKARLLCCCLDAAPSDSGGWEVTPQLHERFPHISGQVVRNRTGAGVITDYAE
jgi:hypothetical protein